MPDPTPGEACYTAYTRGYTSSFRARDPGTEMLPWPDLLPSIQALWERAAQAVLESQAMLCPVCAKELERVSAEEDPPCGTL